MDNDSHYKFYEYLRNHPPIKMQGAWMISKHSSIKEILDNPKIFRSNRIDLMFKDVELTPKILIAKKTLERWILHSDGDNAKLKSALAVNVYGYFKTSLPESLNSKLKQCFLDNEELEFRNKVAIPVVCHLLMDILKVPRVDIPKQEANIFKHMQNLANLVSELHLDKEQAESFAHSLLFIAKLGENYDGINDEFEESEYLIEYDNDIMQKGAVYHAFTHDTVNALCNTYYIILKNRDKIDLQNIETAVTEAMRIEPAVHALVRTANEDTEVRKQKIKKDDILVLFVASSNRDSEYHNQNDLDEFLPNRKFETFNFGSGMHACLGQHLAKYVVNKLVEFGLENRNDSIKKIVWDTSNRTYRNMHELVVA